MRVLFFGSGQSKYISQVFREAGHQTRIFAVRRHGQTLTILRNVLWCDMLYAVSGNDISSDPTMRMAAMMKKKIVIHWIGTDVLQAAEAFKKNQKVLNEEYPHIDLVCAKHLQKELQEIGIQADYVPIAPLDMEFEAIEVPKTHAVLSYIPQHRESFYGVEKLKALARRHPDIPFYIVANDGENDTDRLPNMHYQGTVGRQEMEELHKKCSIMYRYPEHDGLPLMMLEALGFGRQAINRYPFPHVITPEGDSIEAIDAALGEILASPPRVNQEGSDYVKREFTKEKILQWYQKAGVI